MAPALDVYLAAAAAVPAGQTRSFLELAALAGRPGAARAAGRALARCAPDDPRPWHRVTAADGSLARDPDRAAAQLARLRAEGARPAEGEALRAWAARRAAPYVGHLPSRRARPADDPAVERWSPLRVEALPTEADARARGFLLPGEAAPDDGGPPRPPDRPRHEPTDDRDARTGEPSLAARVAALDGEALADDLRARGLHRVPALLTAAEVDGLLFAEHAYERTIHMRSKGYGVGRYGYLAEPLPPVAATLRAGLYERLLPLADGWSGAAPAYPPTVEALAEACRAAGQRRASCILLEYGEGGVNHPHRDVYGSLVFPFQALVVLSRRGRDFEGGDFLLLEERGDGEATTAVPADEGELVVFAAWGRPAADGRVGLRHAMSPLTRGTRHALGIVFNLAE